MTSEDVKRLAQAIALANGHSHPEEWADQTALQWEALAPAEKPDEEKK